MERKRVGSGTVWETSVGYSRAIKVGNTIEVSGTTAIDNDEVIAPGDVAGQTRFIFEKIAASLEQCGASLNDVVRTRMYVVNIDQWEAIGSVHGEFFSDVRPAATMVEISRLIRPELLVEIEVTAITGD